MVETRGRGRTRILVLACLAAVLVLGGCASGPRTVSAGDTVSLGEGLRVTVPAGFTGEVEGGAADPAGITQGLMIRSDALKVQINVVVFKDAASAAADAADDPIGTPKPLESLVGGARTEGYAAWLPGNDRLARLTLYITPAGGSSASIFLTPQPGSNWGRPGTTDAQLARQLLDLLAVDVTVKP